MSNIILFLLVCSFIYSYHRRTLPAVTLYQYIYSLTCYQPCFWNFSSVIKPLVFRRFYPFSSYAVILNTNRLPSTSTSSDSHLTRILIGAAAKCLTDILCSYRAPPFNSSDFLQIRMFFHERDHRGRRIHVQISTPMLIAVSLVTIIS